MAATGWGTPMGIPFLCRYVLPGEEVRAAEKSKKKKVVWAKLLEVTSASKERTRGALPAFSDVRRMPLSAHRGWQSRFG